MSDAVADASARSVVGIIGASTGIGRELALQMAAEGKTIVASARSRDKLDALADESNGDIRACPVDVADPATLEAAIEDVESEIGRIDCVVYAAGVWQPMKMRDFSAATIETAFRINVLGAAHLLEHLLPRMRARGGGQIALVSSVAGYRGLPLSAAYGSSKAALTHIAEALKPECDRAGIKLQVISPGFVDTPMTAVNDFPMPMMITAEAAARHIRRGLRSSAFDIHFPKGFTLQLKLLRLLPYRLYFAIARRLGG